MLKSYDYDAFGNELVWNYGDANPFRYSGEYFDDETDLYYLRARYYWPSLGQFTQEDTYRGEPNNPNSLNLYTYCYNDPVQHIDPSGHVAETPLDWISLGSSFVEFVIAPSWTTAGYLVWDVIAVAAPGAPGSYIAKGIGKYDDAVDIVRGFSKADDVADTTKILGKQTQTNIAAGIGYDAGDIPVRIDGEWSINDMKQGLQGHPPSGLGRPDIHHGGQMPGAAKHEVIPSEHRGNKALHANKYNQGVTPKMRASDRNLHWWYRAREQGADWLLPDLIYD